jgi:hypothetical protein
MKKRQSAVSKYLADIGRKGGLKSKRKLTKRQARAMAKRRWSVERQEEAEDERKRQQRIKAFYQWLDGPVEVERFKEYSRLVKCFSSTQEKRDIRHLIDALANGESPNAIEANWNSKSISGCSLSDVFASIYHRSAGYAALLKQQGC